MLCLTDWKFIQLSRTVVASETIRLEDMPDFMLRRVA